MVVTKADKSTKGQVRRAQILELARGVLISRGYDAFVMREIATLMEMKLGNLQYYFPTRKSLIETIVKEEARTNLHDLRSFRKTEEDEMTQLTAFVKFVVKKWRGDSGKVLATMAFLSLHQDSFRKIFKEVYTLFCQDLAAVIAAIDPGHSSQSYIRRARLITALIDGASMQVQRGNSPDFLNDVAKLALQIAAAKQPD